VAIFVPVGWGGGQRTGVELLAARPLDDFTSRLLAETASDNHGFEVSPPGMLDWVMTPLPVQTLAALVQETQSLEVVESVVCTYLDLLDSRVKGVQEAGPDLVRVERAAHLLKGASAVVGATDMAVAVAQIESAARAKEPIAEPLLASLDEIAVATKASLIQALKHLTEQAKTLPRDGCGDGTSG